jgi:hypothetical protein
MQQKYNYSSGKEFTKSDNTDYVGYFNIDDKGNAYQGRYYDTSNLNLIKVNSLFSSDYHCSRYFKDRYVFDTLTLPNDLDKILIQPNEIVNFSVLNKKLSYLHDNLLYLYSQMFMGDTDVPVDDSAEFLCNQVGTENFSWLEIEQAKENGIFGFGKIANLASLSSFSEFDKMKRFVVIPFKDNTGLSIFAISDTHLIGLTSLISDQDRLINPSFTLHVNVIDENTNQTCYNLEDIAFDGRYLYVTDSKINGGGQLFKYDITSYYSKDSVFEWKRFLVETIGGKGELERKNKFNGCTVLGTGNKELWIYDSGNDCLKIFDHNLIWKRTIKISNKPNDIYKVIDIRYRKMNDNVYVLFERNYNGTLTYGLMQYDNYKLVKTYIFDDILYPDTDVRFNRMAISEQDSNVFYVTTNNVVFKKFFSKPEKTFAVFNRKNFYPEDTFAWELIDRNWEELEDYEIWNFGDIFLEGLKTNDIFISPSNKNKDDLYLLSFSCIIHFNEYTKYISLLRDEKLNYYNFDSIQLEKNEYNQSLVINKEIYKLFANIIQLKNNLKGRFYAEFDEYGDVIYKDYIYLSDEEINLLNIDLEFNSFINDNELVEPNVINRLFKKLYDIQLKILDLSNVKLKNIKTRVDVKVDVKDDKNIFLID